MRKKTFQASWIKEHDIFLASPHQSERPERGLLNYIQEKIEMRPIKLEFGLDHYLHVQLYLPRTLISLQDGRQGHMLVLEGDFQFLMVRLSLISMEVQFFVKEMVNYHGKTYLHQQLLQQAQIMEGTPGAMDKIPFRLFLNPKTKSMLLKVVQGDRIERDASIGPTLREIHQKFSTRYYLNFILTDHEKKKYFKQQEIIIVP